MRFTTKKSIFAAQIDPSETFAPRVSGRMTRSTLFAATLCLIHVAGILFVFRGSPPLQSFCCLPAPVDGTVFVVVGIILLIWMKLGRSLSPRQRKWRFAISLVLSLFIIDAASGGTYRWFEWSMRLQAKRLHIEEFQTWTEQQLNSPQQLASWEHGDFDGRALPASLLPGFSRDHVFYRMTRAGGPALQTSDGGIQGWGFIVGKSDMKRAYPQGINGPSWQWSKMIRPGVFIYILET